MKKSQQIYPLNHHAYYLVGDSAGCESLVAELDKSYGLQLKGNPDFSVKKFETFTIDDARALKANAEMRPVGPSEKAKKIFVIQMNGITAEAQNALLKLLEEPAEYIHFFLIIPSAHLLLPTVRSRMSLYKVFGDEASAKVANSKNAPISKDAALFLQMSIPKRLDFIKKLMDDITKEKKSKQDAIVFLNAIESHIYGLGVKESVQKLVVIEKARSYMHDRAPSFKMLLEYVGLNI